MGLWPVYKLYMICSSSAYARKYFLGQNFEKRAMSDAAYARSQGCTWDAAARQLESHLLEALG